MPKIKVDPTEAAFIASERAAARRDMARLAKEDAYFEALDRAAGAPIVEPKDWTAEDLPRGGGAEAARQRMIYRDIHRADKDPNYKVKWNDNLHEYLRTHDERGNPINH